jgi:serine/threonine-protein kinase
LKPANVFLVPQKRGQQPLVKVLDFGVSKFRPFGKDLEASSTGTIVGTPYYMAPEQARAEKTIDHRADLFSVGVILYRALAGRVPFLADSFTELIFKVVLEDAPPVTEFAPDTDPELAAILHKAMARAPDVRFQNADDLVAALAQWLERQPAARPSTAGQAVGAGSGAGGLPPAMLAGGAGGAELPSGIVPRADSPAPVDLGIASAPGRPGGLALGVAAPPAGAPPSGTGPFPLRPSAPGALAPNGNAISPATNPGGISLPNLGPGSLTNPGSGSLSGGGSASSLEISLPMTGLSRKGKVTLLLGLGALALAGAVALIGFTVLSSPPPAAVPSAEVAPTEAATAAPSSPSTDSSQPSETDRVPPDSSTAPAAAESGTASSQELAAPATPSSKSKPAAGSGTAAASTNPKAPSSSAVGRTFRTKLD